MEVLPRRWLKTDAGRAAIAQVWFDGVKQKRIAAIFGYSNLSGISSAIGIFLDRHAPPGYLDGWFAQGLSYGDFRKTVVPAAIEHYRVARQQAAQG